MVGMRKYRLRSATLRCQHRGPNLITNYNSPKPTQLLYLPFVSSWYSIIGSLFNCYLASDRLLAISMADVNLNDVLELLLTVAHEAGEMMLAANLNEIAQDTKLNCAYHGNRILSLT